MPVYPIIVDGWQFECCGKPFAVGDRVRFPLELMDPAPFPDELHVHLARTTPAGAVRTDAGDALHLVRAGGLIVAVPPSGRQAGVLHEDRHSGLPDSMPRTEGVVERLAVASVQYAMHEGKWRPQPRTFTLRPIERTPGSFPRPQGESPARGDAGMVVHLRVD